MALFYVQHGWKNSGRQMHHTEFKKDLETDGRGKKRFMKLVPTYQIDIVADGPIGTMGAEHLHVPLHCNQERIDHVALWNF